MVQSFISYSTQQLRGSQLTDKAKKQKQGDFINDLYDFSYEYCVVKANSKFHY